MLARSLSNLEGQSFGFQIKDRVLVSLHNPETGHTQPELAALHRQIEDRLQSHPGSARFRPRALQSAHRQLGRDD